MFNNCTVYFWQNDKKRRFGHDTENCLKLRNLFIVLLI